MDSSNHHTNQEGREDVAISYITSEDPLETVDDRLEIIGSYGPYGSDLRFEYRAMILLAEEVKKLRVNNYHDAYRGAMDRAYLAEKRLHAALSRTEQTGGGVELLEDGARYKVIG